jgi:hypothetical protein
VGKFKGKTFQATETSRKLVTKEGEAAVQDALSYLKEREREYENVTKTTTVPLKDGEKSLQPPTEFAIRGLEFPAEDHATDIGNVGTASHTSCDGETGLTERVQRYGTWKFKLGECKEGSDRFHIGHITLPEFINCNLNFKYIFSSEKLPRRYTEMYVGVV